MPHYENYYHRAQFQLQLFLRTFMFMSLIIKLKEKPLDVLKHIIHTHKRQCYAVDDIVNITYFHARVRASFF